MIFQDYARKYYESGFQVIPCNGKKPFFDDWTDFSFEKIPEERFVSWELKYKSCNIGLVCGPISGVMAIDVDTLDPEFVKLVPPSPIVRLGRPERAGVFLYKYNSEIVNRNFDEFELLISGRQFMLPPSIHPDIHIPYSWKFDSLLGFNISDLPFITPKDVEALIALGERRKGRSGSKGNSGRNNKLKAMIVAARQKFKTDLEIAEEIYAYDRCNYNPRLFTDSSEGYAARTEDEARANAHKMAVSVLKSYDPYRSQKSGTSSADAGLFERVELYTPEIQVVSRYKDFPAPMGLMGEIYGRTLEFSVIPRPAFAMATAVSLMATLTSGRYRFAESNLTTNMYAMTIGKVSQGKGDPQRIIKSILGHEKLRGRNLIGASKYASREALVANLPEQRFRLDILDEASSFFTFSKGNERTKLIATELNELWSNGPQPFRTSRAVTRKEVADCVGPQVNLLFAIQPDAFIDCMERMLIDNGFIHRFLIFTDIEKAKMKQENTERQPYVEDIVDMILQFFPHEDVFKTRFGVHGFSSSNDSASKIPMFIPFPVSSDARQFLWELSDSYQESQNDPLKSLAYAKAGEQVRKIALNHALGRWEGHRSQQIELDDVLFAKELLDCTIERNRDLLSQVEAGSDFQRKLNRMQIMLIKNRSVTRSHLLKNLPSRSKDLNELIVQAVEIGWAKIIDGKLHYNEAIAYD
jgi:hypothetical protein